MQRHTVLLIFGLFERVVVVLIRGVGVAGAAKPHVARHQSAATDGHRGYSFGARSRPAAHAVEDLGDQGAGALARYVR